jgi:hypothetical protein
MRGNSLVSRTKRADSLPVHGDRYLRSTDFKSSPETLSRHSAMACWSVRLPRLTCPL